VLFRSIECLYSCGAVKDDTRLARILHMIFEHDSMHMETLLYMMIHDPNISPPLHVAAPPYRIDTKNLKPSTFIKVEGGKITVGVNDNELSNDLPSTIPFSWDNERPEHSFSIPFDFEIQTRPVSVGEYLEFLNSQSPNEHLVPASWINSTNPTSKDDYQIKTIFGPRPISSAMQQNVILSHVQASAYAESKGMRLPTEGEISKFRKSAFLNNGLQWNVGFTSWMPANMRDDGLPVLADAWEWTGSVWEGFDGYKSSELYPGYSSDFLDGKHNILVGGSWATHPRIAMRESFRNWYQRDYLFVFATFRCVKM